MFAAILDFILFLFVTFFLVPGLVILAHVMRSWALKDRRSKEEALDLRPKYDSPEYPHYKVSRTV